MRIGIMVDEIRFGGVEKVAIEEVRALKSLGHEAFLIVLRRTPSNAFREQLVGVERIFLSDLLPRPLRFSFKIPFFRFFSLFHLTYAVFSRFVALPQELDAIIAHGTYTCFSGIPLAKSRRIPVLAFVWDPIDYMLRKTYPRTESKWVSVLFQIPLVLGSLIDKWICHNSSAVLTGSNYHASRLQSLVSSSENVKVVFPGAHNRSSVNSDRGRYVVLATAWKEGKDPQYLLELAGRLEDSRYVVAGAWIDEAMKERFVDELKRRHVEDRISVIGALDEDELLDLYSRALVFLQVRADMGFGLPALEAAGQGCTFIIPSGQSVCDIFTSGADGFIVSEKDTVRIVEHLRQLFNNPSIAVQMGENAWDKARAYSWEKHAETLVRIVKNTTTHRRDV